MLLLSRCPHIVGQTSTKYAFNSTYSSCNYWRGQKGSGSRYQRSHVAPASKSLVVATSENWWEDELEYDAITDYLKPKNIVLVAPPEDGQEEALRALRASLQRLVFNTAVSGEQALRFAQQLWSGRDGPPYFHKVRMRPLLDKAATEPQGAQELLQELLGQNWRVELDYGLGVEIPEEEALLVVCSAQAVQQLLGTAGVEAGSGVAPGSVVVLHAPGRPGDSAAVGEWGLRVVATVSKLDGASDLQELIRSSTK